MHIGVLGINFKSAEIDIREFVSKACLKRFAKIGDTAKNYACVVLSTCNRTEIYFSASDLAEAHSELLNILREEIFVPFEHKLYSYFGIDCFLHLAKVTSGLDSAIVAESEIQRQVKIAYEQTLLYYSLPSCMHYLFQKSLKLGKNIRSNFFLLQNQVSIAKILFEISQDLLDKLSILPVLFIGNSEINRRILAYFKRKGVKNLSLCTRSLSSAAEMAQKHGLSLLAWEELYLWQNFPLVICGSNAPHYIVSHPTSELTTRLVFDLSVPRNVDPSLSRHPQVTLLNMESLSPLIENRQKKNRIEIHQAESILFNGVHRYMHSFQQKEKRMVVCA
jgi:glutamyl-tRNA reductase